MLKKQSLSSLLFACALVSPNEVYAQNITPSNDGLNTTVHQIGNQYNITGGTQAGFNLFHGLQKLGLSTGEVANFLSSSNVNNILTRVTGGEASLINGLIQVTGGNANLFIMNPAGIVFGNNASLNVPANFSATTATGIQVGSGWFGMNSSVDQVRNLTGNVNGYAFTNTLPSFDTTSAGVISNEGTLAVNAGKSVTLVGGMVVNTGTIATPEGNITIAASDDNKFVTISNEGSVLSLNLPIAEQQVLGNAPVLRGVDLPSLLRGKTAGTAIASGNLDVSGDIGGNVQVLGNEVSLVGANIDASGVNGGGTVLIGGDFQGTGTTPKSQLTTVDANSTIHTDAVTNGDGGTVVVWSDGNTNFDGTITAKGGIQSGNGGLVETSGKNNLVVGNTAQVNTMAPQGEMGTWLLDPTDLTVVASGGTGTITAGNNSPADSTINNSTIVAALDGTNVNLTATNSITVNAAIDSSANGGAGDLALTAPTTNLNAAITLRAGSTLSGTATTVNVGTGGTVQNGVDAAAAGGTVNLAATTYTLGSTVAINKNLTVKGAGAASTTVSGNSAVRVFNIGDINNSTVNLDGLTISNGSSGIGGGSYIFSGSTLNIANSTFSGNSATYGGAIFNNFGTITAIANSTFSNNSALSGGAIYNGGTISAIANSTFSGNSATYGGAISSDLGTIAVIANSTFSGNSATGRGGAISNLGTISEIANSTFSGNSAANGGAILNNGTISEIANSTFSGNSAIYGGAISNNFGTIAAIANSTFSGNSASFYGGAIYNDGTIAAIANSTFSGNSAISLYGGGAISNFGTISEIANSTFSGNSADDGGAIFNFGGTISAIANSTFSGNSASFDGGTIYNYGGTISAIANSTFSGNSAANGGAISNNFGTISEIANSTFSGNSATNSGAIYNVFGTISEIANSTFSGNSAFEGGAIFNNQGTIAAIANSTFFGNSATNAGGAIYNLAGTIAAIANSTFSGNSATNSGAIYNNFGAKTAIANSTFSGNSATDTGGAIFNNNGGSIAIANSILVGNNSLFGQEIFNAATLNFTGANIVGTNGANGISGSFTGATPITPTGAANTVINTTLANNGGSTQTHALVASSIAIEAGDSSLAPTTDQRGLPRFGNTDIGAYEYQFKVTNTNDSGLGSLRSALTNTNGSTNTETVIFRIPTTDAGYTGSYWSIAPTSALPSITKPVIIDGYSQPTATPNTLLIGDNAKLAIELTGTNAGAVDGLTFANGSGGSILKGLAINNFGHLGVWLQSGSDGTTVAGNFIGTDITGTTAKSNAWEGIRIDSGSNFIGGTPLGDRNIISANKGSRGQIWIVNSSGSNQILNNYLGTDASGLLGFGFGTSVSRGITIENSPNNVIGGTTATTTNLSRNVISGNGNDGIAIVGVSSTGTTIQGNYIGITADGNTALGNRLQGIYVESANNLIGGATTAARNIISGNGDRGIILNGINATNNTIQSNYIGTDVTGTNDIGNISSGVLINSGSANNTIRNNTISGNDRQGGAINFSNANVMVANGSHDNTIAGNFIGTNATGTGLLTGTTNGGIRGIQILLNSFNNTVGGMTSADRNIISGNRHFGVELNYAGTNSNRILGNYIGTDVTGNNALGNGNGGIQLYGESPSNNVIGTVGAGNVISGNGQVVTGSGFGIILANNGGNNNIIQSNFIGTNATGTAALSNTNQGIYIQSGTNNLIGGINAGEGNIISGNLGNGLYIETLATNNVVQGNYIGTNKNGTAALPNQQSGINLRGTNNTIGGSAIAARNIISGNIGNGIYIPFGDNNKVQGNYIGTDVTGNVALGNQYKGIHVQLAANNNIIGTDNNGINDTTEGNVISANNNDGITIDSNSQNNTITGNFIGTNATGTAALGNRLQGIYITSANNTIGGTTAPARNIISANQRGVYLDGANATGNTVQGNYIGTDVTGNLDLGNSNSGVFLVNGASNNLIGGTASGAGNLISGNNNHGIDLFGTNTVNNQILGNLIGTKADGMSALGNTYSGILINGSSNNIVGNGTVQGRNIISGSQNQYGVFIGNVGGGIATGNKVQGNYIGTNITGTAAIGNAAGGVVISGASNNIIGTDSNGVNDAAEGNLISGNNGNGLQLTGTNTNSNVVAGNKIGTQINGTSALGNSQNGVLISAGASNNIIGGTAANTGNAIAFNAAKGVAVTGNTSIGNQILGNSIFNNTGIGIDLNNDGITANGTNPRTFPNNGQNYPLLITASGTNISGVLNSLPNTTYRLEFFASDTIDQGKTLLGTANVTTDANGIATFSSTVTTIPAGQFITATATNSVSGTSEFSATPGITLTATAGAPQSTTVNQAFATPLQVTVRDTRGNLAGNGIPVNFAVTTAASGATGIFTSGATITTNNAIATAPIKANTITGTYNASASATGAPSSVSFLNLTNTPDVPYSITATGGTPQNTVVNTAFANQLQVLVQDQFGNAVPNSTVTFTSPNSGASTSVISTTASTDANGVAKVSVTANTIAGTYDNTATLGALTPLYFNLTNNPDVPYSITATGGTPQSTVVNTAFANQLQVLVQDQFGNVVPKSTVTFTSPNSGASTSAAVTTATTDANGVAKVSVTANTIAGNYTNTATSGAAIAANFSLTNNPDVPASISATGGTPQATIVNTKFGQLLQVTVRDQFGNLVPNSIVTFTSPNNGASGKFAETAFTITAVTDVNGIAQVPITSNNLLGDFISTAKVGDVATTANFNLTNVLPTDDPQLLRKHRNEIARLFPNQLSSNDLNFNTESVAFLLSDEIEVEQLYRLLRKIVDLMNQDGGELQISPQELWQNSDISLVNQSTNQDVIKVAIHNSVDRFIGSEYIDLVDINIEPQGQGENENMIKIKVLKAPKMAHLKND